MKTHRFSEFKEIIDREVKQNINDHIVASPDSLHIVKSDQLKDWVNQALQELCELNEMQWYSVLPFTPATTSDSVNMPFYMKRIDKIYDGNTWKSIYFLNADDDTAKDIVWDGDRQLTSTDGSFVKDVELKVIGIKYPEKVENDNSLIDIEDAYTRVLILNILMKWAARDNIPKQFWWAEYNRRLRSFEKANAPINARGLKKSPITFGV